MIHVTKRVSTLLLLYSTRHGINDIDLGIPYADNVVSSYLEILQDAAIQVSLRVLNIWFGKSRFPVSNDFLRQRLVALDLSLSLNPFTGKSSKYKGYITRIYQIGQTLNKYRYLNAIHVSAGYSRYRALRLNYIYAMNDETRGFQTMDDILKATKSLTESTYILSENTKLMQRKHGNKKNPFDDLDLNIA